LENADFRDELPEQLLLLQGRMIRSTLAVIGVVTLIAGSWSCGRDAGSSSADGGPSGAAGTSAGGGGGAAAGTGGHGGASGGSTGAAGASAGTSGNAGTSGHGGASGGSTGAAGAGAGAGGGGSGGGAGATQTSYACGSDTCTTGQSFCYSFSGGVPGSGTSRSCTTLPAGCTATPTCACVCPPTTGPTGDCSYSGAIGSSFCTCSETGGTLTVSCFAS